MIRRSPRGGSGASDPEAVPRSPRCGRIPRRRTARAASPPEADCKERGREGVWPDRLPHRRSPGRRDPRAEASGSCLWRLRACSADGTQQILEGGTHPCS